MQRFSIFVKESKLIPAVFQNSLHDFFPHLNALFIDWNALQALKQIEINKQGSEDYKKEAFQKFPILIACVAIRRTAE